MNSAPVVLSDTAVTLAIVFTFLIPFAWIGLTFVNTGLSRSRSASHMVMSSLSAVGVSVLVFFLFGFGLQSYPGGPGHFFTLAGRPCNWIGAQPFFFRTIAFNGSTASLTALFGMFAVALAALIPIGSGSGRWRLSAICASTALFAAITFPLFAHWVWGGGWLAQLGSNYGLGVGFLDSGGSSALQAVGGFTALSIAWILGARRGKYGHDTLPNAIPGHNSVLVLLGCLLAAAGWVGLNSAGAILFSGIEPGRVVLVAINTILAASMAGLTAALITGFRFERPDASLTANGWVAGLAASSAGCAFFAPAEAVVVGFIAGVLVVFLVEMLELRLGVDDPGGSISAHVAGGLWGMLAVAVFIHSPVLNRQPTGAVSGQWLAQLVGLAAVVGMAFPITYGLNRLLNRFYPQRVAPEGERHGMDLYELGGGAYPEFLVHGEEFDQH